MCTSIIFFWVAPQGPKSGFFNPKLRARLKKHGFEGSQELSQKVYRCTHSGEGGTSYTSRGMAINLSLSFGHTSTLPLNQSHGVGSALEGPKKVQRAVFGTSKVKIAHKIGPNELKMGFFRGGLHLTPCSGNPFKPHFEGVLPYLGCFNSILSHLKYVLGHFGQKWPKIAQKGGTPPRGCIAGPPSPECVHL